MEFFCRADGTLNGFGLFYPGLKLWATILALLGELFKFNRFAVPLRSPNRPIAKSPNRPILIIFPATLQNINYI